jgi:hypothetical protein
MHPARFDNAAAALRFILAGSSVFTLKSGRTGQHYTFEVDASEDGSMHFAKVRGGEDQAGHYIGFVGKGGRMVAGKKGKGDAPSFKALDWTLAKLAAGAMPDVLEVWHEGRCGRCGRALTDPESIETGLGPICRGK